MKLLLNIFILFLLTSCSNTNKGDANGNNELTKDSRSLPGALKDPFVYEKDSVILPEFEIELKLSENAEKKLEAEKESVIVVAYFSGIPKDTTRAEYLKYGRITIGSFRIELFDKRVAKFKNVKISKDKFELLSDKNFEVLINIVSGRRTSSRNLLDADILEEGIYSIGKKRHILNGKLISGD